MVTGRRKRRCKSATFPGQPVKAGSMGRAAPGYRIALLDDEDGEREKVRSASRSQVSRSP